MHTKGCFAPGRYFDPITNFPVQSLEELSDRANNGSRCFERMLMCKPYSLWYLSPGRQWHDRLKFGMLGQEVCFALLEFA